jgi:hypothetical protein
MSKKTLIAQLQRELAAVKEERLAGKRDPALHQARKRLKQFQKARLGSTHADLLAAGDTHDAAEFFLEELYGDHDLGQRDADLERIIPTLQKVLSYEALRAITDAIVLDALSERLDSAMARELGEEFTEARYLAAFRNTARADRERQVELVDNLGEMLVELVRMPLVGMTLTLMGGPAALAGLGDLHAFLQRGFDSFGQMEQPARFVATIVERERIVIENIYSKKRNPFKLSAS